MACSTVTFSQAVPIDIPTRMIIEFKDQELSKSASSNEGMLSMGESDYVMSMDDGSSLVLHTPSSLKSLGKNIQSFELELHNADGIQSMGKTEGFSLDSYKTQLEKAVTELNAQDRIMWAEPNVMLRLPSFTKEEEHEQAAETITIGGYSGFANINDAYRNNLWGLSDFKQAILVGRVGISVNQAWDTATGKNIFNNKPVIVAVVDTGIIPNHPDISGALIKNRRFPTGYVGVDMIDTGGAGSTKSSNDGNGRDYNPFDNGDGVKEGECSSFLSFTDSKPVPSSWHGLHVAGTIAATRNNKIGVAGVAPDAKIVPVRAIGKCGGWIEDIADAIVWAAGGQVLAKRHGVGQTKFLARNPNPAHIINLSLGESTFFTRLLGCPRTMQRAINIARSRGSIVVAAAGNESQKAKYVSPANCQGVITVGAVNSFGKIANFSNHGRRIDVVAPGQRIYSTFNEGKLSPIVTSGQIAAYGGLDGTSMAAPHVSGVIALILSVKPDAKFNQIQSYLRIGAQPFFRNSGCTPRKCGAGYLNAAKSIDAAMSDL